MKGDYKQDFYFIYLFILPTGLIFAMNIQLFKNFWIQLYISFKEKNYKPIKKDVIKLLISLLLYFIIFLYLRNTSCFYLTYMTSNRCIYTPDKIINWINMLLPISIFGSLMLSTYMIVSIKSIYKDH